MLGILGIMVVGLMVWGLVHTATRAVQRSRQALLATSPPRRALPAGDTPDEDGPLMAIIHRPSAHPPDLLREVWAPRPGLPAWAMVLINLVTLVFFQSPYDDEGSERLPMLLRLQRHVAGLRGARLELRVAPHPDGYPHPQHIPWRAAIVLGGEAIATGETTAVMQALLPERRDLLGRLLDDRAATLRLAELRGETGDLTLCFELHEAPEGRDDPVQARLGAAFEALAQALMAWPAEHKEAAHLLKLARVAETPETLRRALLRAALDRDAARTLDQLVARPDPELMVWAWQAQPKRFEVIDGLDAALRRDALAWLATLDALPPEPLREVIRHLRLHGALETLRALLDAHGSMVLDLRETQATRKVIEALVVDAQDDATRGGLSLSAPSVEGGLSLSAAPNAGALSRSVHDA